MIVDVDKLRDSFLDRIEDKYNQEEYFIDGCFKHDTKYSERIALYDSWLELFFRENNHIYILGQKCVYCVADSSKRKVKLAALQDNIIGPIN